MNSQCNIYTCILNRYGMVGEVNFGDAVCGVVRCTTIVQCTAAKCQCRKAGRKKKQLNEGVEKDEEERINRRREGNGGKRTKPECFFFFLQEYRRRILFVHIKQQQPNEHNGVLNSSEEECSWIVRIFLNRMVGQLWDLAQEAKKLEKKKKKEKK